MDQPFECNCGAKTALAYSKGAKYLTDTTTLENTGLPTLYNKTGRKKLIMNKVKADLNVAVVPVQRLWPRKKRAFSKTGSIPRMDFASHLETEDPNLKYYYDYTQSIAENTKAFGEGCGGNGRMLP